MIMKFSSKSIWAALILIGAVLFCSTASAIPSKPVPERLVNDFAGLFRPAQKAELEEMLVTFSDTTSNQIAVVTVNDLEGYDSSEYATRIGLDWKVGKADFNNGIVVLVKPKTPDSFGDAFIAVGYGLEGAIPDAYCKRIIETEMIPRFRENDYYGAVTAAVETLTGLASGEIKVVNKMKEAENEDGIGSLFWIIIILLMIWFVARSNKKNKGGNPGTRTGRTTTPRYYGGGYSSSSGSSGSSSSGGSFGGFGGGSFGGGGASGSW